MKQMSETLKLSQSTLRTANAAPDWHVESPFPPKSTIEHLASPFRKLGSPFRRNPADIDQSAYALPLVKKLCHELRAAEISFCHWKSNWKLNRWLRGDGDLDILVADGYVERFAETASNLGFVQAYNPDHDERPDIFHFYGWDTDAEKFVHLHVYRRLLVGHDLTNNYHLPVERLLLESVDRNGLIPVPQLELELIVFVVRKVLASWSAETFMRSLSGRSSDLEKIAKELDYLEALTDRAEVHQLLPQTFPTVDIALFERCLESLRMDSPAVSRTHARRALEKALAACAMRDRRQDYAVKVWRLAKRLFAERLLRRSRNKHSINGGVLIAFVGGDGSGKTTAVKAVTKWLDEVFDVRAFHFGKPRRSPLTLAVIITLRLRTLAKNLIRKRLTLKAEHPTMWKPGYLRMFRWVCAARDRHRVYAKARRLTQNGGIAICDRYVLPQIQLMDGPNIVHTMVGEKSNWLHQALQNAESKPYGKIMEPDVLLVLRVHPEIAVARKTDEHEHHVRPRSQEIWEADWTGTPAHVIDAGKSAAEVLNELRAHVWQQI
jgi:thymidylate kinase